MEIGLGISGIVIIFVMILLSIVLWKVAKLLLIPIQILLFLALMFIAYKLLFDQDKINMISDQDTRAKIQGLVNKASDSAVRFVKDAGKKHLADKLRDDTDQSGKDTQDAAKPDVKKTETPNAAEGKAPTEAEHVNTGKESK